MPMSLSSQTDKQTCNKYMAYHVKEYDMLNEDS